MKTLSDPETKTVLLLQTKIQRQFKFYFIAYKHRMKSRNRISCRVHVLYTLNNSISTDRRKFLSVIINPIRFGAQIKIKNTS